MPAIKAIIMALRRYLECAKKNVFDILMSVLPYEAEILIPISIYTLWTVKQGNILLVL